MNQLLEVIYMKLLVSIIIPIYKVEPYIVRCIESTLCQTYRNLEVILVDDCSPDHSIELAKECIETSRFSNDITFIYLHHDSNRGLSAARNTGIKASKGEYVFFLDSDDEITPICIEKLITQVLKYPDVDIVQGNTWCNDFKKQKWLDLSTKEFPEYSMDKQWINRQLINIDYNLIDFIPVISCNKLIRRKTITDYGLWFKEGIVHEDEYWRLMSRNYIRSIAFCNDITYNYYVRENSIATSNQNKDKKSHSKLEIYRDYLPTICDYPPQDILKVLCRFYNIRISTNNIFNRQSLENHFQEVIKDVLKTSSFNIRTKIALRYLSLPKAFVRTRILKYIL